jgi:hypothetical protein
MMVRQDKAEKVTSVLLAYTRTMSIPHVMMNNWYCLHQKKVNVLSFKKTYFVEIHVYNVKSAN